MSWEMDGGRDEEIAVDHGSFNGFKGGIFQAWEIMIIWFNFKGFFLGFGFYVNFFAKNGSEILR